MYDFKDVIIFFSIYAFLGWVMESVYASIRDRKFINRGFLTGTVCPIYGFGAILIIQSSTWISNTLANYSAKLVFNILFAIILTTVLEYVTGLILEKIFNRKWWDYSDNALNLNGYICFKYSLLWGGLAFILLQVVHPFVSKAVLSMPSYVKNDLSAFLFLYFLVDTIKSVIEVLDLRKVIINYSNVSDHRYYEKIIRYKRFFFAFPRLFILNSGIINRDIRSILNDRMDKIKVQFKKRFL